MAIGSGAPGPLAVALAVALVVSLVISAALALAGVTSPRRIQS